MSAWSVWLVPLWLATGPSAETDYQNSAHELAITLDSVGTQDPKESARDLSKVIEQLIAYPQSLSADTETLDNILHARITLVWLALSEGDRNKSMILMDEVIRSAHGRAVPVDAYGRQVMELYNERLELLQKQGTSRLKVNCSKPCDVIVNEQLSPNPTGDLLLGAYRVWVGAKDGSADWQYHDVSLTTAGDLEELDYATEAAPVQDLRPPPEPEGMTGSSPLVDASISDADPKDRKRMLPRWAEALGITAGIGLAVTGGVMLALDGRCKNDFNADPMDGCPVLWENTARGWAMVGSGAALLTASGVLLIVDEVRVGKAKGKQATLVFQFQF